MALEIIFLGVSGASPGAGDESTCFIVNKSILVDAGWNAAIGMQSYDVAPTDIDHVFITHCHQDHVLGLPGLFFANRKRDRLREEEPILRLYGSTDLQAVCAGAAAFLQAERYPDELPAYVSTCVQPGETVEIGTLQVEVGRSFHPVDARCYRFTDTETGACAVISGDTAYHAGLPIFARECDVLIHEVAAAANADPTSLQWRLHSRPQDAARVAKEAGASTLVLVHYDPAEATAALSTAKETFPNTRLAKRGQKAQLLGPGQVAWLSGGGEEVRDPGFGQYSAR